MENFEFIGKSLYLRKEKILVIADLHIGYEQMLAEQGTVIPRGQFQDMLKDMKLIFERLKKNKEKAEEIVLLGDLKHEFGKISRQEWGEVSRFLDFLFENVEKVVLIKGNHDTILEPIARKEGLEIVKCYVNGSVCFVHGDKEIKECIDRKIKTIILGHKHPAITLSKGAKKEKYKCFLVGKWKEKKIIILPSFFSLVEGSEVYVKDTNLGFKFNIKEFEVYIPTEEEVLDFGKVKNIEREEDF